MYGNAGLGVRKRRNRQRGPFRRSFGEPVLPSTRAPGVAVAAVSDPSVAGSAVGTAGRAPDAPLTGESPVVGRAAVQVVYGPACRGSVREWLRVRASNPQGPLTPSGRGQAAEWVGTPHDAASGRRSTGARKAAPSSSRSSAPNPVCRWLCNQALPGTIPRSESAERRSPASSSPPNPLVLRALLQVHNAVTSGFASRPAAEMRVSRVFFSGPYQPA